MGPVFPGRFTARVEEPFVVFLIGMRVNRWLAVRKWLPVARAMGPMLRELSSDKASGFLSAELYLSLRGPMLIQYWRSFDALHAYAHVKGGLHTSAWAAFNRLAGRDGAVGIWHESYLVEPSGFECIYNNMPRFGLAAATEHVPVTGRLESALGRLRRADVR